MAVPNSGSSENTGLKTGSNSTGASTPIALTFGDFGTQLCGAWSMVLLHAQGEMAKTGSAIAQSFTEEQINSYKGQNEFLKGGLSAAYSSADKQKAQMEMQAASEFASAGTSALGLGLTAGAAKGLYGIKRLCPESAKLNNAEDKLTQQKSLLKYANEKRNEAAKSATISQNENKANPSSREKIIFARKEELIGKTNSIGGHGGSIARELSPEEVKEFGQKPFKRKENHFYREHNKVTDEEAGAEIKTRGAYKFETLDEKAIEAMTPDEKKAFIDKLERHVGQTEGQIQTLTTKVSMFQQNLQQVMTVLSSGLKGTFGMYGAADAADAKKDDAQSTIANQDANIAGSVTNGISSTKDGVLRNVEQAMQGFGGAYNSMRG